MTYNNFKNCIKGDLIIIKSVTSVTVCRSNQLEERIFTLLILDDNDSKTDDE